MYADNEILQTQSFRYEARGHNDHPNEEKYDNQQRYGVVRIQFNQSLDFNNQNAQFIKTLSHEFISQIAHIMHRHNMQKIGFALFGKSHYIDPFKEKNLNIRDYPHLKAMLGLFSTIEYTQKFGTIVSFRNKIRLLEKRRIIEIMQDHYNYSRQDEYETEQEMNRIYEQQCCNELVGRFFITLHARKVIRKIHSIDFSKSLDDTFPYKGGHISFRDYYWQVYSEELKQDFNGLIQVKNRGGRYDYYPPELCYFTGYPPSLRGNKKITGIIARNSSIPLNERIGNFEDVINKLNRFVDMNNREILSNSNSRGHVRVLNYGDRLLNVNGHRVEPATILYNSINDNGIAMITDDQLQRSLPDMRPFGNCEHGNGGNQHVVRWGIAYFTHPNHDYDRYAYDLLFDKFRDFILRWFPDDNVRNDMNLIMDPYAEPIEIKSPEPDDIDLYQRNMIKSLEKAIIKYQLEGIVVILPSYCSRDDNIRDAIYHAVKTLGNVQAGIVTQCVRASTIHPETSRHGDFGKQQRRQQQSMMSLFRQFMVKLGIIPWKVILSNINDPNDQDPQNQNNPRLNYLIDGVIDLSVPTMIIGIDVNHNRNRGVSTVGFISTYDSDFCRIHGQIAYQSMGQEVVGIDQLQALTENALRNFKQINGVSPQQIFVYRDGVSLGELDAVSKKELLAIRRAALKVSNDLPQPRVQFMVVQKRVNQRFFEWDEQSQRLVGAKPRTIVDADIVSSRFWDFYLIACGAPRDKVANPVRVIIINDDLRLAEKNSKNDIELFTYALCNLYYGWGGAVKTPHVIKYADKIAEQYSGIVDYLHLVQSNEAKPRRGIDLTHHML